MIYIRTEDSSDGFILCQKIIELYFKNKNINIETLHGIFQLKEKTKNILHNLTDNDTLIIVYDDIIENPLIAQNINDLLADIEDDKRIIFIPTISFELEILTIYGIEYIFGTDKYNELFKELRDIYDKTKNIYDLTTATKNNSKYQRMYEQVKKEKHKKHEYSKLSADDFEKSVTIESISKKIMNEIFTKSDIRPIRNCWINNCCYKRRDTKCTYEHALDIDKIKNKEHSEIMLYKIRALITETSYYKLVTALNNILGTNINENIQLIDILNPEILNLQLRNRF